MSDAPGKGIKVEEAPDNPENLFRNVTILIAEDSPTQAEQLRFLLEAHHFTVISANNGKDALALAHLHKPTLIITDVVMPEMDGHQLCRAIKSDPALKSTPVVMVTSLTGLQDIARSLECGADNFLRKPCDPAMLISRIHYILLNLNLRKTSKVQMGVDLYLAGKKHFITSERSQIIDLLVSTYEEALHMNDELQLRQKEIARSNLLLRGLYDIAEGLMHASTENEVCEKALQGLMQLPCCQAGWIYLSDAQTGIHYACGRNLPPDLNVAELRADRDCRCQRLLRGTSSTPNVEFITCERLSDKSASQDSHLTVPLLAGKNCLGVMNILTRPDAPANDDDMKAIKAVSSEIAIALERVRLLASLAQRAGQLEAANKELESFSYSISHDLKAPLRAIDGFAAMLAERASDRLDDEDKRLLTVVRDNSETMRQLIDELLSFSRTGNARMTRASIDMTALAQQVFDSLLPPSGESGIRFSLAELPPASGDNTLIRQVWANLIGNAIKYSGGKAHPSIEISCQTGEAENIYCVRDNGAGFDMRNANRLFGVFQRLHGADEFPGHGIGLATVQRIVTRHEGRIWAEGWVNAGAVFYFSLPRSK
ncbi:MAG: hybrid sensor histidine kinase/response regulator [Rhodocyclales bacterium]|nr:hybrid sensor histidine kinase/response regulator [Rhodocyclales bacterium]